MNAHRAAVLAGLLVVSAVLAGCAGSTVPASASVPLFQWEEAEYEVQEGDGTAVGTAIVNLTLRGERLHVEASFFPFSGQGSYIRGVADATTGQRLYLDDHSWRKYYSESTFSFPNAAFWALMGPAKAVDAAALASLESIDDLLFMVGPQWVALANPQTPGAPTVSSEAQGTRVVVSAPCPRSCPSNMNVVLTNDWLLEGGLLPARAHHFPDSEPTGGVVFVRTIHQTGPPAQIALATPEPRTQPDLQPLCGRLPCEPEDWPERLSLARILQMAESTVQWTQYEEQHANAALEIIHAGSGGTYLGSPHLQDDVEIYATEHGAAYYSVEGHGRDGFAVVERVVQGLEAPFVPTATQLHTPWHQAMRVPEIPDATLSLDAATLPVLNDFEVPLEDLRGILIWYWSAGVAEDDPQRARLSLSFGLDADDETYMSIQASALDGTVFQATRNLPHLAEDPNRR